jgi:hypothetical protein
MGVSGEAQGEFNEDRNREIYERWAIWGDTQQQIARNYGMSQQRVAQIIKLYRDSNPVKREDLQEQSIQMLKELRLRQFALAEQIKAGAPVAVGKDGTILYDVDGKVVRDYSGYMRALAEVRLTDAQIAKRMGLDAPERLEATQTVRYEIAGLDAENLS